ncbi:hypothetical protein GCM10011576_13440 [Micromonospora parathelypteridis]|nr:hypothetical protein GCM10011576_13440 [Micromonospora parathelypteridis]
MAPANGSTPAGVRMTGGLTVISAICTATTSGPAKPGDAGCADTGDGGYGPSAGHAPPGGGECGPGGPENGGAGGAENGGAGGAENGGAGGAENGAGGRGVGGVVACGGRVGNGVVGGSGAEDDWAVHGSIGGCGWVTGSGSGAVGSELTETSNARSTRGGDYRLPCRPACPRVSDWDPGRRLGQADALGVGSAARSSGAGLTPIPAARRASRRATQP